MITGIIASFIGIVIRAALVAPLRERLYGHPLSQRAVFSGRGYRSRPGPARVQPLSYVAEPQRMPSDLCWQCGGKVKERHTLCPHCGATVARTSANAGMIATSAWPAMPGPPPHHPHAPHAPPHPLEPAPWGYGRDGQPLPYR